MPNARHKHAEKALSLPRLLRAVRIACRGMVLAIRTEPNMRLHLLVSTVVLLLCLVVRPDMVAVTCAVCASVAVCSAELLNTAVEYVTDLASGEQQLPLAAAAKDIGAGAVFVTALGALAIGVYLLVRTYPWHWLLFSNVHLGGAVESVIGIAIIGGFAWASRSKPGSGHSESVKEHAS